MGSFDCIENAFVRYILTLSCSQIHIIDTNIIEITYVYVYTHTRTHTHAGHLWGFHTPAHELNCRTFSSREGECPGCPCRPLCPLHCENSEPPEGLDAGSLSGHRPEAADAEGSAMLNQLHLLPSPSPCPLQLFLLLFLLP